MNVFGSFLHCFNAIQIYLKVRGIQLDTKGYRPTCFQPMMR